MASPLLHQAGVEGDTCRKITGLDIRCVVLLRQDHHVDAATRPVRQFRDNELLGRSVGKPGRHQDDQRRVMVSAGCLARNSLGRAAMANPLRKPMLCASQHARQCA